MPRRWRVCGWRKRLGWRNIIWGEFLCPPLLKWCIYLTYVPVPLRTLTSLPGSLLPSQPVSIGYQLFQRPDSISWALRFAAPVSHQVVGYVCCLLKIRVERGDYFSFSLIRPRQSNGLNDSLKLWTKSPLLVDLSWTARSFSLTRSPPRSRPLRVGSRELFLSAFQKKQWHHHILSTYTCTVEYRASTTMEAARTNLPVPLDDAHL